MLLVWQKGAISDLDYVFEYVGAENPSAALTLCELIEKRVGQLTDHAFLGRSGRVAGTRELVVVGTPYIVVYRIKTNQVDILAVLHTSKRWPDEFS